MFAKLISLDDFVAKDLIKIFYACGSLLALLLTLIGLFIGTAALVQSPPLGLLTMVLSLTLGATLFLAVRLAAETVLAVFRMHQRFIGGGPKDAIPQ